MSPLATNINLLIPYRSLRPLGLVDRRFRDILTDLQLVHLNSGDNQVCHFSCSERREMSVVFYPAWIVRVFARLQVQRPFFGSFAASLNYCELAHPVHVN